MIDPNMSQLAAQTEILASNSGISFDLAQKVDPSDVHSFQADMARYSELERLNNNVYFYNANKLDFSKVDMGNIGDAVLKMAQEGRLAYENAINELKATADINLDSKVSLDEVLKKQYSGFVTTMEIEMTAKLMSKSVENIYILLRQ
jgi:hypothetical protein